MLALPLALLIALPSPQPQEATADVFAAAQEVAHLTPALIPYGTASGAWALYEDGAMVALLEDADGRPLFALDARMSATGEISGDLHTLEYAGNPALVLPHLRVIGQAQIPAAGNGSFSLVIYNPLEDDGYVFPNGQITGVLTRRQGPMIQPGSGKEVANLFVLAAQSAELYVANAIHEAWVATAETAPPYTAAEIARIAPSVDAVQRVDAFTAPALDPTTVADIALSAPSADSAQHVEAFAGAGADLAVAAETARIAQSNDSVQRVDAFSGAGLDPISAAAAQRDRAEGLQAHSFMIVCPYEPPAGGQGLVLARWVLFL